MFPEFVKPNDPLKSSWANNVVSSLRSNSNQFTTKESGTKKIFKPFDPVFLEREGDDWYIKLKEAYFFPTLTADRKNITFGGTNLQAYPKKKIEAHKNLYFNPNTKALIWDEPNTFGNVLILEFIYEGDNDFTIFNRHPFDVSFRGYPPFFPITAKGDDGVKVAVTKGCVVERLIKNTGDVVIEHIPSGVSGDDLSFSVCEDKYIHVTTDNKGIITDVSLEGGAGGDGAHYFPPVGDDYDGTTGNFYYKLFEYASTLTLFEAGSNIDHYRELPWITNTDNTATTGFGRVIKELKKDSGKYLVRGIKKATSSQLKITEESDYIRIGGNQKYGTWSFYVNGSQVGSSMHWDDGLWTDTGDNAWSISLSSIALSGKDGGLEYRFGDASTFTRLEDWKTGSVTTPGVQRFEIPKYIAGANITISGPDNNVYTIASTVSSMSASWPPPGWEEMTVKICVDGTPTDKIILVKSA